MSLEDKFKLALEELKIYGNCKVCGHCDRNKYPLNGYCDLGGCCGAVANAPKTDEWIWHGLDVR